MIFPAIFLLDCHLCCYLKVFYFLSSSGAFGEVWQAQCSPPINGTEFVAVKCLKVSAIYNIKALASARAAKKRGEKAESPEIRRILPVPIYVFDDSEQKVEFEVRIKPCSHHPNCIKNLL